MKEKEDSDTLEGPDKYEVTEVALNRGLVELTQKELITLSKDVQQVTRKELKEYGLEFTTVQVKSINAAGSLEVALRRRAAAQVEVSTAAQERDYLTTILSALSDSSSPDKRIPWETAVIVGHQLLDTFRDWLGNLQANNAQLPPPRQNDED